MLEGDKFALKLHEWNTLKKQTVVGVVGVVVGVVGVVG